MHSRPKRKPVYLADLLVIGFGNTLRSDDGVGPRVAETIEAMHLPRVWALSLPQLGPEEAECLSRVPEAIFVDAAAGAPGEVELRPLEAAISARVTSHTVGAPTLLAIARATFGHAPRAWILTIPATDFGFGETLSPVAAAGLETAVDRIVAFAGGTHLS